MVLPALDRARTLESLARFDREERDSPKWRDWESKENFKYAIVHDGRLYPVKEIVSLATGTPTSGFSGGPQANGLVQKAGFNVEALHLPTENEVQIALHELLLAKAPTAIEPTEAYEALADKFALPERLRTKPMDSSNRVHWQNRVQFARRKLVDAGVMDPSEHGRWKLAIRTQPKVWIEKSLLKGRPDRATGPNALGSALWSPTSAQNSADIYRNMRLVQPNDIVLHLTDNTAFTPRGLVLRRLRELRDGKGWPQEVLAEEADVSVDTIQRAEAGRPTLGLNAQKIARALEVTVAELTAASSAAQSDPSRPLERLVGASNNSSKPPGTFNSSRDNDLWHPFPEKLEPFKLMTWHARLTKFIGRAEELSEIKRWALSPETHARVRMLAGPGGAGKTRLAAELCAELRSSDWDARFLTGSQLVNIRATVTDRPNLYVIDYPEERTAGILHFFDDVNAITARSAPLRVLFLTRQTEDWWQTKSDLRELHVEHLFDTTEIRLQRLSIDDAVNLFYEAFNNIGESYKLPLATIEQQKIVQWCEQDAQLHLLPLFIMAMAVHCAIAGTNGIGLEGPEVIKALVARERTRLDAIGKGVGFDGGTGSRIAGLATVTGAIKPDLLRRLAEPHLELGLSVPRQVVNWAKRSSLWSAELDCIPAVAPDICAAALLFSVLDNRSDMAPTWLWEVVSCIGPGSPDVLGRLARDIFLVHGQQARDFANWLVEMVLEDPDRAEQLEAILTEQRPSPFVLPLSLAIGRALTRKTASLEKTRAMRLHCLAERLWESAYYTEAINPIQEAVRLRREMALRESEALPDLGQSLNCLALILHGLGRRQEAQEAAAEAVEITRKSSREDDSDSLHQLGRCLNTRSTTTSVREIVEDASKEVVSIYGRLEKSNWLKYGIWLARGLHNLSGCKTDKEESLQILIHAVEIKRRLSEEAPYRFEQEYALSSLALVKKLVPLKRYEEATPLSDEVLEIYGRHAKANPARFAGAWLDAMNTRAAIFREIGEESKAHELQKSQLYVIEELLKSTESADVINHYAELIGTLATVSHQTALSKRYDEATSLADKALELGQRAKNLNISILNPSLQLFLAGAHLNRGNANSHGDDHASSLSDYMACIEVIDELEAKGGFSSVAGVCRMLALLNTALIYFKENKGEKAAELITSMINAERRQRELFIQGTFGGHEKELIRSLEILLDHLIPEKASDLLDRVVEFLGRLSGDVTNLTGDTARSGASWRLTAGKALTYGHFQERGLRLLCEGSELARRYVEQLGPAIGLPDGAFCGEWASALQLLSKDKQATTAAAKSAELLRPDYERLARSDPESVEAIDQACNLANALVIQGDCGADEAALREAQLLCEKALERTGSPLASKSHTWGALMNNLGHSLYRQGELKRSSAMVRRGIDMLEAAVNQHRIINRLGAVAETTFLLKRAERALTRLEIEES